MSELPETASGAGTGGGFEPPAPADVAAPELAAPEFAALNQKLDVLSVQVAYLIEQAQETARRQRERSELMQDALPIANDAIALVTEQLNEIQEYIDLSDILRLAKRLLRNGRNLDKMFGQLESLMDFAETAGPLANSVFEKITDQLEEAEHRGYFALARGGARAVDRVAGSLAPEDLDCMANNAVVVLSAFQGLCQPVESANFRALLRQLRDPDVRRGLAVVLRMLHTIGAGAGGQAPAGGGTRE